MKECTVVLCVPFSFLFLYIDITFCNEVVNYSCRSRSRSRLYIIMSLRTVTIAWCSKNQDIREFRYFEINESYGYFTIFAVFFNIYVKITTHATNTSYYTF